MLAALVFENLFATALVFGPLVGSALLEDLRFRGDGRRRGRDATYWRLQAWQLGGLALGLVAARQVPSAALPGTVWLWPVLGCVVGLAGVALRWWSILTLGRHFTRNLQIGADHVVVDAGPYRVLRHPSYAGAILMFAGVGIGLGNWLSLAACVVLPAIGYIERIPREERLLREQLGAPYEAYADRRRRLLPGVW